MIVNRDDTTNIRTAKLKFHKNWVSFNTKRRIWCSNTKDF